MSSSGWKRWALRVCSLVLLAGWMYVISGFSAQDGEASSGLSMKVSCTAVRIYDRITGETQEEEQVLALASQVEPVVRKLAHMAEFGILAVLFFLVLAAFGVKRFCFLLSAAFAAAYASLDEFHQLFVGGRSARATDVLVDTAGAALALFCLWLVVSLAEKAGKNRKEKRKR